MEFDYIIWNIFSILHPIRSLCMCTKANFPLISYLRRKSDLNSILAQQDNYRGVCCVFFSSSSTLCLDRMTATHLPYSCVLSIALHKTKIEESRRSINRNMHIQFWYPLISRMIYFFVLQFFFIILLRLPSMMKNWSGALIDERWREMEKKLARVRSNWMAGV